MMSTRRRWLIIVLVSAALLVMGILSQVVVRQPVFDGQNIALGASYRLDRAVEGDVAAFAESIELLSGSSVGGDAAFVGGRMRIDGEVNGSLTAVGDQIRFGPEALIRGDATLLVREVILDGQIDGVINIRGERLEIAPDARFERQVYACTSALLDARSDAPALLSCEDSAAFSSLDSGEIVPLLDLISQPGGAETLVTNIVFSTIGGLTLACLSILAVVVFPRQISHMEEAVRTNPRNLGAIGFMILLLALGITAAYIVLLALLPPLGVALLPLFMAAALVVGAMLLAGWVTIALRTGDFLIRRFASATLPPLVAAVAGSLVLAGVWSILALIPFGGLLALLAWLVPASIGLGAVALTRVGTRSARRSYFVQG